MFDVQNVTIANAASLSGAVDLGSNILVAIKMPAAWTAANLTFQACESAGGTFMNVYDDAGTEIAVTAAASEVLTSSAGPMDKIRGLRHIKIRSGTAAVPVNQGAARTLILFMRTGAGA